MLSTAAGGQRWPQPGEGTELLGEESIDRIVELLGTRNPVSRAQPGPDLRDGDVASVVERGQACYRQLLHAVAPGVQSRLHSAADRRKFLNDLGELTHGIAHATSVVATLAFMLEGQPIPQDAESEAYVRAVVEWVCNQRRGEAC